MHYLPFPNGSGATGLQFSRRCRYESTTTESSSTLRSFEPTRTLRAEKGDHQQRTGSFSRWILDKGPCARRHERASAPRRAHARPATRVDRRGSDHQRARAGPSVHSRHGLRFERDPRAPEVPENQAGHPSAPHAEKETTP